MANEGLSIRQQLLALLASGVAGHDRKQPAARSPSTSDEGKLLRARLPESQSSNSWKEGVRPLAPRYKTVVMRPSQRPDRHVAPAKRIGVQRKRVAVAASSVRSVDATQGPAVRPTASEPIVPIVALSDATQFKEPDAWVDDGRQLQPFEGSAGQRSMRVTIGVDFGTAYSKIAMRAAGKVFFIDWSGLHQGESPYVLSGELSELADRTTRIGRAHSATHVYSNLKLPFLEVEKPIGPDDIERAALFLAWILRYARAWLYQHQRSLILGHQLMWEVNIGAPTGSWSKGQVLRERYQVLGLSGWRLSQSPDLLTLPLAREVVAATKAGVSGWGLEHLEVLPEFAAQIAGYVNSPHRTDGLHALVDVGAGTLDAACFWIMRSRKTGIDRFAVYASKVEPLGTHYLMQVRLARAERPDISWPSVAKIPNADTLAEQWACDPVLVRQADDAFLNLGASAIHSVLSFTRHTRNRNAEEWRTFVPVFLTGGGSGIDVYRRATEESFRRGHWRSRVRPLPRNQDVEARIPVDDEAYSRLSVAYGLTYDAEQIGELIPPSDIPPDFVSSTSEWPNHEDLYTKP